MKILTKSTFLRKHTPPNVAIPHLLVYFGPILVNFSNQKLDFKNLNFSPIINSSISLYNLKRLANLKKSSSKSEILDSSSFGINT